MIIDLGSRQHVFCGCWTAQFRFVRFAANEKRLVGGAPKTVMADWMACLRAGVVANVVGPNPD